MEGGLIRGRGGTGIPIGLREAKAIIGNDRLDGSNHWSGVLSRAYAANIFLFLSQYAFSPKGALGYEVDAAKFLLVYLFIFLILSKERS